MCEGREHVIDRLYHRAIIFTLYSLVDAPALNHQHATPIPLRLSLTPLQASHMLLALICTEELYSAASISKSAFTDRCQVSSRLYSISSVR